MTRALQSEAIRLIEQPGPLEDSEALRHAAAQGARGASHAEQIAARAGLLGKRLGLTQGLARARRAAPWALLLIVVATALAGLLLAGAVVDAQDRRINVLGALAALLGAHAITFTLWLLALAWPGNGEGGAWVARLWAQLTARLALGRGAEAQALLQAAAQMLTRSRLLAWVGGVASHTLWCLSLAAAICALVFALSFKRYTLGWESTLLTPDTLAAAVHALGKAPGWLGFAVPEPAQLAEAGMASTPAHDRMLAWWLIGCVLVYGLLPRLLALGVCLLVWRARRRRLAPDLGLPYYRQLIARLDALAPPTVIDADTVRHDWDLARHSLAADTRAGWAVLGFELPPEHPWPPAPLPEPTHLVARIAGSAGERLQLLRELSEIRPRHLVLACHAASSPDRGTERFLRELLPVCGECRVWLSTPQSAAEADIETDNGTELEAGVGAGTPAGETPTQEAPGSLRWRRWLGELGLSEVHCFSTWAEAARHPQSAPAPRTPPPLAPPP